MFCIWRVYSVDSVTLYIIHDVTSNRIENSIDKKICVVHILGGISTIKQMKN